MAAGVSKHQFREAMARLGAAVNVVTTAGPAGCCGYTATAVCSVSDSPATMLVCLNRASSMHGVFTENGVLCVNILSGDQRDLSVRFAGQDGTPMASRFADDRWTTMRTGAPAHRDALCVIDCRISAVHETGTHSVFFCDVLDIRINFVNDG